MDAIFINNPVEKHFSKVPNSLWSLPISVTAKAIFGFLLSCQNGSTVRVALIEQTLRIGRDKRRAAMKELALIGLIKADVGRCKSSGRIVTKSLTLDTRPLLRDLLADLAETESPKAEPESPKPDENHLGPENPSYGVSPRDGFSGPVGGIFRASRGGKSGPLYNTNTKTKKKPDEIRELRTVLAGLGSYARCAIREGKPLLVDGVLLKPTDARFEALQKLLRNEDAKGDVPSKKRRIGGLVGG